MENTITINKKFIEGMIKMYKEAVRKDADGFTYDGYDFVTSYAKYFIQYYAPQFGVQFNP